jgi:hypothetical protein
MTAIKLKGKSLSLEELEKLASVEKEDINRAKNLTHPSLKDFITAKT